MVRHVLHTERGLAIAETDDTMYTMASWKNYNEFPETHQVGGAQAPQHAHRIQPVSRHSLNTLTHESHESCAPSSNCRPLFLYLHSSTDNAFPVHIEMIHSQLVALTAVFYELYLKNRPSTEESLIDVAQTSVVVAGLTEHFWAYSHKQYRRHAA